MHKCWSVYDRLSFFSVASKIVYRWVTAYCCCFGRNVHKCRVVMRRINQQEAEESWMRASHFVLYQMF
jgi:hypothetical protein